MTEDDSDAGTDELAKEQIKLILDSWSPFARVSRRLLADLVDRSKIVRLQSNQDTVLLSECSQVHTAIVIAGVAAVGSAKGKMTRKRRGGVYANPSTDGDRGQLCAQAKQPKKRDGEQSYRTAVMALLDASSATPELAWSVEGHRFHQNQKKQRWALYDMCLPELVWCDTDLGSRGHLEPLVHLLADAIARDLRESTAIVTLGPGEARSVTLIRRHKDRYEYGYPPKSPSLPAGPLTKEQLYKLVRFNPQRRRRSHVFVLSLGAPGRRSTALAPELNFDRIVFLTDRVPEAVPTHLRDLLNPRLFAEGNDVPHYCAFITSVLVARDVCNRVRRRNSFDARLLRTARRGDAAGRYPYLSRLDRDACVVPVDLEKLVQAWERWTTHRSKPFLDGFNDTADGAISPASVARWGRAVTNRRIGFALSGGGACAYRAGPVLEYLERAGIPIDVFAGLSGGALVGAFYCHSGLAGFNRLVALGPVIQLTAPLAMVTTWPLEAVIDAMLGGTGVEDLEIRFAAVGVALPPTDLPMTAVVVRGTVGEAVRVSGTLPPVFAETVKGGMRYTDGGAGTIVPAQVARDFGADIVLACNAIPGPSRSNPLPEWLARALTIGVPLLQRQIDFFAWHSYFWRQASHRFLREADAAFEFKPEDLSLMEAGMWLRSRNIVEDAKSEIPRITEVVQDMYTKWRVLGDRWWLRKQYEEKRTRNLRRRRQRGARHAQ
jgi:predicted acylesterase/phospholipase RssA